MSLKVIFSYIVWDMDPRIFPSIDFLRWYGLLWALGVLSAFQVMQFIYRKENKNVEEVDTLALYLVLGAVLGARLGHIFFYDAIYYWSHPLELLPFRFSPEFEYTGITGLASHGGVLGAILALYFYNRKYKKNFIWLIDRIMIVGVLLGSFIRFGNLMNSEMIGIETSVSWAFVFTQKDFIPRHPAQLYEALSYLFIFTLLFVLWKSNKLKEKNGFLIGLGLILIFSFRFGIEFLKIDQVPFEEFLPLNMGQLLSIPLILTGIVFMMLSLKGKFKQVWSTSNEHIL